MLSVVYDHYNPQIPWPVYPYVPNIVPNIIITIPDTEDEVMEMARRIEEKLKEFSEAKKLAKRLDELMEQHDCVDPEKEKLEERIKKIEDWIESVKNA